MKKRLYAVILKNIVLPTREIKVDISDDVFKRSILKSINDNNGKIVVISLKNRLEVKPSEDELPNIVMSALIKNSVKLPNGEIRVTLKGLGRCERLSYEDDGNSAICVVKRIESDNYSSDEERAYVKKVNKKVLEYVKSSSEVSNSIVNIIKSITSLSVLTDTIISQLDIPYEDKYWFLQECNPINRAKKLIEIINEEISSIELDKKIDDEIRSNLSSEEEKFLIKEKISVLSRKLGISDREDECRKYLEKIDSFLIDEKNKEYLKREVHRFEITTETSPEFAMIRSYLDFIINIPWNKSSESDNGVNVTKKLLNKSHYGLDKAKNRILEYLILKENNSDLNSPILCLVGPPGTGKTTFARGIALSIGRQFVHISVGGLNDSAELVGHRRTYIGSAPGKIMEGIRKSGVNNPVILIDEVDKMIKDYRGDPSSTLLEILDSNQNKEFIDNYVGLPYDLSNVIFILTANDINNIPSPLLDRLEIINVNSYTVYEKIEIIKKYSIPRLAKMYKFNSKNFEISDNAITKIINEYTNEAGMRELERQVATIIRKVLIDNKLPIEISTTDVVKYLGKSSFTHNTNMYDKSGIVNVPAKSEYGGLVINIECEIYDGNDRIITTGSLGNVMKESISIAVSHLKANAHHYGIDASTLNSTIHIHALESATKKDGPSAGLGIGAAILSKILDKKVPQSLAFTGEISLDGRVHKVGGLKEKIISSYNQGIKRIFIPTENIVDLSEIPEKVSEKINIVPVNNFDEVYEMVFNK